MIEYALLFGLGFLTAILVAMLVAPLIHRRIVKFTEDRILATVPVSRNELRAQKDMVRAEMAVAVARTEHGLRQERQKAAELSIKNDVLASEASRLHGENSDLRTEIDEITIGAGELRANLRAEEMRAGKLNEALTATQHSERMKETRIDELLQRLQRLTMDIDNFKIELATRDTEAESFRSRINTLRDEREALRAELKQMTTRAKDAELKLAREANRAVRLEDRLSAEVSGSVDKDSVIERRIGEINRLKERLKAANVQARETARTGRVPPREAVAAEHELTGLALPRNGVEAKPESLLPTSIIGDGRAAELMEDVRSQASAAGDMLVNLRDTAHDDALRNEIADIAAKMIAITGQREGVSSPIRAIIATRAANVQGARTPLSERASRLMHQE